MDEGILTPVPGALETIAMTRKVRHRDGYAVFHGTHIGCAGPIDPTGKTGAADGICAMTFEGQTFRHMTTIRHDGKTLRKRSQT